MNQEQEFDNLKKKLEEELTWPTLYMFKFIVLADSNGQKQVEAKFPDAASISHSKSKSGKYISITIKEVMLSADKVVNRYKEMKGIEGLMSL